jgi:hypothetical protein
VELAYETRAQRRARLEASRGGGHHDGPGSSNGSVAVSRGTERVAHAGLGSRAAHGGHVASRRERSALAALTRRRVGIALGAILTAALLGAAGYAGIPLLAAAVAWGGLVLAWGWPPLLGSTSRVGAPLAIALTAVGAAVATVRTTSEPYLTYVPIAIAAGLLAMFVHQLVRRDGRARLTESVAVTASGLSIAAIGACYIALARLDTGVSILTIALAAVAAATLADLLMPVGPLRPWLLPLSMVLGGIGAAMASRLQGEPATARAVLIGFVVAAVGHALRRVLLALPTIGRLRAQVTAGVASVLVSAVVAYALAWVLVA